MLLTAALIAVWVMGHDATNTVGLWTFTVLYFARVTAKLNLYFGVPRINVEFIPRALAHMGSYFRMAPVGWFFPCSVTALSLAVACWMERLYSARVAGRDRRLCPARRDHRAGASGTLADGSAIAGCETLALDAARAQTFTKKDTTGGTS